MTDVSDSNAETDGLRVRRYLLDLCSDEERHAVEQRYLADGGAFEEMLAIENELAYDYAQGVLTPEERRQFERKFLSKAEHRQRTALAGLALPRFVSQRPVEAATMAWWQRPQVAFLAAAAIFVLLAGMGWLALTNVRLREEMRETDNVATTIQQMLEQRLAEAQSARATPPPVVVAAVLSPGRLRDQAVGSARTIVVPAGADVLRIEALLAAAPPAGELRGTLKDVEGRELWSGLRESAVRAGSRHIVTFDIPARTLAAGDFELVVASAQGQRFEDLAEFYLTIARPAPKVP